MGANRADTTIWFLLPVLLYGIPLAGLLAGVVAWQGDAGEEGLLATRDPGRLSRPLGKWLTWSGLLSVATLCLILPSLPTASNSGGVLSLWAYSIGEVALFVALGLALGRLCRDAVLAHSMALMLGLLAIAGGGVIMWVAAYQPAFQEHPGLWTFLLMLHPVEALRISLLFSLENLPFDARQLPPLTVWWLAHPGLWFAFLSAAWSALALGFVMLMRPGASPASGR